MEALDDAEYELREAGFLALHNALGPVDAVGFIRLYRPGAGDYTGERTLYIGDPTFEEIRRDNERVRQDEAHGVVRPPARSRFQSEQALRDAGLRALRQSLGLEDARRFMRLYRDEPANVAQEGCLYAGDPLIDEIVENTHGLPKAKAGKAA
jgi:hypothetical protein